MANKARRKRVTRVKPIEKQKLALALIHKNSNTAAIVKTKKITEISTKSATPEITPPHPKVCGTSPRKIKKQKPFYSPWRESQKYIWTMERCL